MKLFTANTPEEIETSAHDQRRTLFITYCTWKWMELHAATGTPIYRYRFDHPIPQEPGKRARGTHHASDIVFTFDALSAHDLARTAHDHRMADMMTSYWLNFAKTGDPNGRAGPNGRAKGRRRLIASCT